MISRRDVLAGSVAAPFVWTAKRAAPPNLLFLMADDHAGYALGCAGNGLARTPNLDRLAAEGVRFANNFCNAPVCTPSRQSILTGLLPHAAGVTVLQTPLAAEKPTIARQLRAAGYSTACIGKMHWNRAPEPGLHGFELALADRAAVDLHASSVQARPVPPEIRTKPQWRPFRDPARIWLNADKLPFPRFREDMRGTFYANRGVEFLKEHRRHPFALWVSFNEPHSPFDFPVDDRDALDSAKFPVLPVGPEDPPQIPLIFRELTDDEKRGINAAYYTSVSFLDRNAGRVLAALKELGLEENTVVIYTADHGYTLGHHGRFEKHCCYDPAMRTPLIVRHPAAFRGGHTVPALTESVDIGPTLLELLGVPPLERTHGRSLAPLLKRRGSSHRDAVFTEYLENEEAAIRTAEWKFIFCSGKRERTDGYKTDNPKPGRYRRLYHLKTDPGEMTNVAERKEYAAVAEKLQRALLRRFVDTHPEQPPKELRVEEQLEWFLRPRDAKQN